MNDGRMESENKTSEPIINNEEGQKNILRTVRKFLAVLHDEIETRLTAEIQRKLEVYAKELKHVIFRYKEQNFKMM